MEADELATLLGRLPKVERDQAGKRIANAERNGWSRISISDFGQEQCRADELQGIAPWGELRMLP